MQFDIKIFFSNMYLKGYETMLKGNICNNKYGLILFFKHTHILTCNLVIKPFEFWLDGIQGSH